MLDQLASYIERDLEARAQDQGGADLPASSLFVSIVDRRRARGFVLPKFKMFFEPLNAKLPLPTRMLLAFTDFFAALVVR